MPGSVHQINVSNGGVPKLAVEEAFISMSGVSGDRQADQVHHGGPERAVCLYSREVIDALRAEGHPIFAGATGENLTLEGLDWNEVRPGVLLHVGAALLEVTRATTPCYKNAQWFIDGRFDRMSDQKHPGWSRMYARVVVEGRVATGDPALLVGEEE
jgi:MOSC domain-containing protein YiiM